MSNPSLVRLAPIAFLLGLVVFTSSLAERSWADDSLSSLSLEKYRVQQEMAGLDAEIIKSPDNLQLRLERANKYIVLGDPDKALPDVEKVLYINSKSSDGYRVRGGIYTCKKDWRRALSDYNQSLALTQEKDPVALADRGSVYVELKQYGPAAADFNKAIALNKSNAPAWAGLGQVYYYMARYKDAVDILSKAILIYPHDAEAFYFRGKCYEALGDKVKAQEDSRQATALGYRPGELQVY